MQHFAQYVFVYPDGYADPFRLAEDPGYLPDVAGRLEDYHIEIITSVPQVGDVKDFPTIEDHPATWRVVEVNEYVSKNSDTTLHEVICTQEGDVPKRQDWQDSAEKVMTFELLDGEILLNDDGSTYFAFGNKSGVWQNQAEVPSDALVFTPKNGRPVQGYDLVVVTQTKTAQLV